MIVTTGGFPNKLPEMTRKQREFIDDSSPEEPRGGFPDEEISDTNPEPRDIEPEINDDYDVDVLDDKNMWKPRLVFENKTVTTTTQPSVIMRIGPKNVDVELFNIEAAPFQEGKSRT